MFWGVALALAVWLAVDHEVDELLDDTLHDAAQVLGSLLIDEEVLRHARDLPGEPLRSSSRGSSILGDRFAWQLVDPQGIASWSTVRKAPSRTSSTSWTSSALSVARRTRSPGLRSVASVTHPSLIEAFL